MVCNSLLQWTTFCQALTNRDMTFSCSTYLDDMPGTLVVPLVVITECIIFTGCWVLIDVRPRVEAKAQLERLGGGLGEAGADVGVCWRLTSSLLPRSHCSL